MLKKKKHDSSKGQTFQEIIMSLQKFWGKYGCVLQLAGCDQWGNMTSGIDLIRKINGNKVFGITSPLITLSSGEKMGKSVKNSIWLTKDKCSVFDFWQYCQYFACEIYSPLHL